MEVLHQISMRVYILDYMVYLLTIISCMNDYTIHFIFPSLKTIVHLIHPQIFFIFTKHILFVITKDP